MTILFCSCDDNKACDMHADELYNFGDFIMNEHVDQPFRDILNKMLEDAKKDAPLRAAVQELYGDDYLTARLQEPSIPVTIDGLKRMMQEPYKSLTSEQKVAMYEAGIRSYCYCCDMWRDGNGCEYC